MRHAYARHPARLPPTSRARHSHPRARLHLRASSWMPPVNLRLRARFEHLRALSCSGRVWVSRIQFAAVSPSTDSAGRGIGFPVSTWYLFLHCIFHAYCFTSLSCKRPDFCADRIVSLGVTCFTPLQQYWSCEYKAMSHGAEDCATRRDGAWRRSCRRFLQSVTHLELNQSSTRRPRALLPRLQPRPYRTRMHATAHKARNPAKPALAAPIRRPRFKVF